MKTIRSTSVAAALVAAVSTCLLILTGCATTPAPQSSTTPQSASIVGTWVPATPAPSTEAASAEQPYLDFDESGTWSASDGCNRVNGTWELDGDSITTTSGPHTLMACAGAALPTAAAGATSVELSFSRLVLIDASGSRTTLSRVTDTSAGPAGLPIGYWTTARTPDAPFLSLSADRSFNASDGCNTLLGTWATDGDDAITLAFGISTLMACDGVDTWLGNAVTATIDGDVMTLSDANGTEIGTLTSFRTAS